MNEKFVADNGDYCIFLDQGIKYSINNQVVFSKYKNIIDLRINNGISFEVTNNGANKSICHCEFKFDTIDKLNQINAAIEHANKVSEIYSKNKTEKINQAKQQTTSYNYEPNNKKNYTESQKSGIGALILLLAVVILVIGCATGATILIFPFIICLFVGLYMWSTNRSRYTIDQEKRLAEKQVELWAAKAKSGEKITEDDMITVKQAKEKVRKKEETKAIVKGAVVGSVVAGDVGAVVGAVVAKNNIDNQKKK